MDDVKSKQLIEQLWENEEAFLAKCSLQFKSRVDDIARRIDFLNDKPFKYGQVVRITNSNMGVIMGLGDKKYGVVVGHSDLEADNKCSYYRIYVDQRNAFTGYTEDRLQALAADESIPEEYRNFNTGIYGSHQVVVKVTQPTFK